MDKITAADAKIDEISFKDLITKINALWKYLLSKWLIILLVGILGGLLGIAYAVLTKPVYVAELSFALEDEKGGTTSGLGGLASQFGFDLGNSGGGAFSGDNLFSLIKSRLMVEKALLYPINLNGKQQPLINLYINYNEYDEKWKADRELSKIKFTATTDRTKFTLKQDSILGKFYSAIVKDNLTVDKTDKKTSIINLKVISFSEQFSKDFAEVLAKTVSDFYVETKTKKSVQNVTILQKQTDSVRNELNRAIYGVASSSDFNPNPNPSLQILRAPSQRRQVDVQANTAILNQLVANLELSKVSLRKETPLIQIIDKPILPLEKRAFGKAKGLIMGSLIGAFLITLILVVKKGLSKIFR